jgi:DNA uptake protein ComE-like DNA-binding protein
MPGQPFQARAASGPGTRLRGKLWLLLTLPIGFTTWAAFLYIGIRARRAQWLVWAGVYAVGLATFFVLDSPAKPTGTAKGVAAVVAMLTWIGGAVHALAVSNDAVRRINSRNDPAVEAARDQIEQRSEGQRLVATQPALARELGVGRPDVAGARDYGLIDVNHCPEAALATLPGITGELAKRIVDVRAQTGGFSSAEDLGMLLDLPPATVDELKDLTAFIQG